MTGECNNLGPKRNKSDDKEDDRGRMMSSCLELRSGGVTVAVESPRAFFKAMKTAKK